MNNLLRTLTDAKAKAAYPECDLKLLLTTVKDGRRQAHDSKLTDPFYDSLEGLLLDLRTTSIDNHDAEAFLKPVSKAEVPDYYDVITNPMDLQTMLKKVKQKQYKSKREFKDDLDLIWSNCFTYNATETHPLRQCAKRLKLKADRLLRNITDRKERADPVIPAALGGGGPAPSTAHSSSPFPAKPNGAVNGIHRTPTITIKPPRKPLNDKSFGTSTVVKREPSQPFAEMPALVRTAEGMRAFAEADVNADPVHLRQYLPPDIDIIKVEETEEDASDAMDVDGVLGDKRPWNGLDDRPRKRQRQDNVDPHLWWAAVHSDALLPNGLPDIARRSSRPRHSSHLTTAVVPPKRRKRKKDKSGQATGQEKTLLARMNVNIRTMRRLRHTHARFAALGLGATAPTTDEFDQGGMPPPTLPSLGLPPPPLQAGLLSMPELPEREEDAVVGENEVDDRPWGAELGIGSAGMRRHRRGKRRARETLPPLPGVAADVDEEEEDIEVGAANAEQCMRWMGSKVLEHAGFQGTSNVALDVVASVTSEYLLNVGRTIRYLCDKYSKTMTPEEIILHTLFESGISRVQDLERYISDDVERYGTRLNDLEKKLVGAYREVTAVDVLDDEGLFEDDEEEGGALTMGDFADALGEDYLGLRELGIAAEFGMSSLSIPKKLLRSKRRTLGVGAGNIAKAPPPLPYPLPPPFIPLSASKVDSQIGLLRPYYMSRFTLIAAAAAAASAPPPLVQPSLPGPSLSGLPPLPGPPGPSDTLPSATPAPVPVPMPPPPPPAPVILPSMELPDDQPSPMQAKMGPLGQILLAKTGTKKKVPVASGAGGASVKAKPDGGTAGGGAGVTVVAAEAKKKSKKTATGVGTGNGRKKSGNVNGNGAVLSKTDGVLMPPPPVHVGMV